MNYSVDPVTANPRHVAEGLIDVTITLPRTGEVRYTAALNDPSASHSEELYARAIAGEFGPIALALPPPSPPADWRGFLQALRGTTVFASLRGQSRTDVAANALATELRTALGEAALGLVEADVIQALVDELLPTLAPEQIAEIGAGISAFNIPLSLP